MGCIAAMIVISSCSADSLEDVKKENSIKKNEISPSAATDTIPIAPSQLIDGVDDKDKTQG